MDVWVLWPTLLAAPVSPHEHGAHHALQPPGPSLPPPDESSADTQQEALRTRTYAYDDEGVEEEEEAAGDDGDDEAIAKTPQEKAALEKLMWTELDIDEDRDEPVFKVLVILVTLGAIGYLVRTHCLPHRHHQVATMGRYATPGGSAAPLDLACERGGSLSLFAQHAGCDLPPRGCGAGWGAGGSSPPRRPAAGGSRPGRWPSIGSLDVFSRLADSLTL